MQAVTGSDVHRLKRHASRLLPVAAMAAAAAAVMLVASVVAAPAASGGGRAAANASATRTSRSSPLATTVQLANLTTYDYSNARYGAEAGDSSLAHLTRSWDDGSSGGRHLDGAVFGQPLVYHGLVVVATENNSVYGIEAATGAIRWHFRIGSPAQQSSVQSGPNLGNCGDIFPLGITSTPVIDPRSEEVFVSGELQAPRTSKWQGIQHWLVGASLRTGRILFRKRIDPPGNGVTYDAAAEQQRAALTLANGRVYVPFGGLYGDCGQYHGYVVSFPESGSGTMQSYQVPTQREGAIWETNGAVATTSSDLYVATGNGSSTSTFDHGDAVIELSPALKELGFWAPTDWAALNNGDRDLGSGGPIQVPGSSLLFEIGKSNENNLSVGYLLNEKKLGRIGGQVFRGMVCPGGGSVFGADAAQVINGKSYIYVACSGGTEAITVAIGRHPTFKKAWEVSSGSPNGPPIVAGGYVWAIDWNASILYGISRSSGKVAMTETLDPVNHFATPGAGDGMLLIPTAYGVEALYGPGGKPAPSPTKLVLVPHPADPKQGSAVTITATLTPTPLGGTVRFTEGTKPLAGCGLVQVSDTGAAGCKMSDLSSLGKQQVVARYSGDPAYGASTGRVGFDVVK